MLREYGDAPDRCTWHPEGVDRCPERPVSGSPRTSLCAQHLIQHRRLTQEPGTDLGVSEVLMLG